MRGRGETGAGSVVSWPPATEGSPGSMRSDCCRRVAQAFRVGLVVLLASAGCLSPVNAEEDEGGWFDFISDLLERPEGTLVAVPLRKTSPSEQPLPPVDSSPSPEEPKTQPPPPPPSTERPERLEDAQLSHVYQAVQHLMAEIHILREELGARDFPPEAELLEDLAPVHVYVKTLEVLTKVTQSQWRLGIVPGSVGPVPFKDIDAADILVNVEYTLNELKRIKAHAGVRREIVPAVLESTITPSLIYRSLADASFLLDALRGRPLTPLDVYRHAASALDEVARVAEKLGVDARLEPPAVEGTKISIDAAQQLLRATYKAISLQTRLGMDASRAPTTSLVRVSPSELYDITNLLLAELMRIKLHLGVDAVRRERREAPTGHGLEDVFALALLMVRNLDRLSEAVSD